MNFLILKFLIGHKSGQFDGLQITRYIPPISILCFVDDCIIFYKNNKKSQEFIKSTLQSFTLLYIHIYIYVSFINICIYNKVVILERKKNAIKHSNIKSGQ